MGVAISVQDVSKTFKLPHEKQNSLKSLFVNLFRGKQTYERQQVLKKISFDIQEGEFFGIVGRNGSGKSTLLKMLAGIYEPNKGAIHINGKLTPFIELGVGFNPNLTGRENVFLNGALLGFNRKEMNAMYDEIVNFAELHKFMDQKLKNYSSGMQVRLAFSIAIRAKSDILLLDEVLAVGDAAFQQKCYNYFEELKREKKTVVFVSHDMGSLTRFCNKAVYLKAGKMTHIGSAAEIADIYIADNIDALQHESVHEEDKLSEDHHISAIISEQTENKLKLTFSYKSNNDDEMYIGISVLRDGISFAEITTSLANPLRGSGKVSYILDTDKLNGGLYEIGFGLFKKENREVLAIGVPKTNFAVKGTDITRGAAFKLEDTWAVK